MEGKRSKTDINKALEYLTRKKKNVNKDTKNSKAAAGPPSRVVFSIPQPPTPPGGNRASYSAVGDKHEGGIAFLGLKVHTGVFEFQGVIRSTESKQC